MSGMFFVLNFLFGIQMTQQQYCKYAVQVHSVQEMEP